jgi:hypothetical protein
VATGKVTGSVNGGMEETRDFSRLTPTPKRSKGTAVVWRTQAPLIDNGTRLLSLMVIGFAVVCAALAWSMHRFDVARREMATALRRLETVQDTNYDNTVQALNDNHNATATLVESALSNVAAQHKELRDGVLALIKLADYDNAAQRRQSTHQRGGERA